MTTTIKAGDLPSEMIEAGAEFRCELCGCIVSRDEIPCADCPCPLAAQASRSGGMSITREISLATDITERLAFAYRNDSQKIAQLCDKQIDPSGNLLGWLREYAAKEPRP